MEKRRNIIYFLGLILIICIVGIILYYKPLFSGKPLGLDALGHLSKVAYQKEFPFAKWDMAWYGGAPFLVFYSPLFYYIDALFSDPIFGSNFLCILSIILTAIGIFLLVNHFSKDKPKLIYGFISALIFLSALSTSYYYMGTANIPTVFGLFTIPFSILFLEKALEKKIYYILFNITIFLSIYIHVFIGMCVILICGLRLLTYYGIKPKNLLKGLNLCFILIIPGILLAGFWLVPFLVKSSSFAGDPVGYIPPFLNLLGIKNHPIWGIGADQIGIGFALFLVSCIFVIYKKLLKNKEILSYFIISIAFFLIMEGFLWKFYPSGVGAIRFILPFSILASIFTGMVLATQKIKMYLFIVIFLLLIFGLYMNYQLINKNYNNYNFADTGSRYWFIGKVLNNTGFPLKNDFDNYRFGTTRFVFSETMNFFLPKKSQTFGYHDQGILYPEILYLMRDEIWGSNETNSTLYFLDWFGIKYFEIGGEDLINNKKFDDSPYFEKILNLNLDDYPFTLYEFKDKTPIISAIKTNIVSYKSIDLDKIKEIASLNLNTKKVIPIISDENISILNNYSMLNFSYVRENPDKITIRFNNSENGDVVLFKEFYYNSWAAKEMPSNKPLKIYKAGPNFMLVIPDKNSNEVIFYQKETFFNYTGIILSIIGLFMLAIIFIKYPIKTENKT